MIRVGTQPTIVVGEGRTATVKGVIPKHIAQFGIVQNGKQLHTGRHGCTGPNPILTDNRQLPVVGGTNRFTRSGANLTK